MINAITQALQFVIRIISINVTNFFDTFYTAGEVLRVGLGIGIAVSVVFMAIKLIKGSVWGS